MKTYNQIIIDNKENIIVECMTIINNNTLVSHYSIYTNLHVDYGIVDDCLNHWHGSSKKEFRKRVSEFKKLTCKRLKLYKVNNDSTYTRLIYRLC